MNFQGEHYRVIKKLDSPTTIGTIRLQDLWLCAVPSAAILTLTSSLICTVLVLSLMLSLKKLLRRLPKFYFVRLLYWYWPTCIFNRIYGVNFLPSHVRVWIRR